MQHCERDSECARMLRKSEETCDPAIFSCEVGKRAECVKVLLALQTREQFRSCTCDPRDPDSKSCEEIQSRIFLHACVSPGIGRPDVPWVSPAQDLPRIQPHIQDPSKVYPNPFDHDYDSGHDDADEDDMDEDDEEEHPDRVMSCIGHRKRCLMDDTCQQHLTDYRLYCRESKKLNQCVTTDWYVSPKITEKHLSIHQYRAMCYKMIAALKEEAPDLFTCNCHMRRADTKEKCDRIRLRIAQNHCLVAAPYFIHTAHPIELAYDDLLDRLDREMLKGEPEGSTCAPAFMRCNSRSTCKNRLKGYLAACNWNIADNTCEKESCLEAIRTFYLLLKPEMTQSLLFCLCIPGDKTCEMVRRVVQPVCSVVDVMPPTCSAQLARCTADRDCSSRLQNYEKFCSYDKHVNGCAAGSMICRNAIVGIQGSWLTTNCTCETVPDSDRPACLQAKSRLRQDNNIICTETAKRDFHVATVGQPGSLREDEFFNDEADNPRYFECRRVLGKRFPPHLSLPIYTRQYPNDSDCSQICHCQRNGSVACKKLQCLQNLVCKSRGKTYEHGAQFSDRDRGQCRCIRSEVVCAKHSGRMDPTQGLFLHVGYSVSDQNLIESNVPVIFEPAEVQDKLATLLNGDSAQQFCRLQLHLKYQGNLVFRIMGATYYRLQERSDACIAEAKELNYRISTRDYAIITDTQLSVLKVSQLETVEFHSHTDLSPPIGQQQGLGDRYDDCVYDFSFDVLHNTSLQFIPC
ncbi:hypothetical protein CAPTEDRAFT_228689 [Capitella teleta]|uniref:GDNF/GAS1 domain-containing protein n=1 Tax=Capitella teleta TaxID=283909 RepID=R7TDS3_CAPTE|nr:hypothetical protein CAPTEDRAFT_228689 [Capitella teleta]|eukprot:ELT91888.1 hypothetical protein CAPTEDRAFT_228689 [Capitella teleta]